MAKSCARCGADEAYVNFQGPTYAETDDRSTLYGAISTGERRIHLHRPRGRCDGRDELQQDDASSCVAELLLIALAVPFQPPLLLALAASFLPPPLLAPAASHLPPPLPASTMNPESKLANTDFKGG
jgi:hypothetical protein